MVNGKLETPDFSFFLQVSRLKNLSDKHSVMLADVFGKIFLNDLVFSKSAGVILTELVYRHSEFKGMQDFLLMFFRYSLNLVLNTEQFNSQYKVKKQGFTVKETVMM